jgi:hypothetical protein
MAYMPIETPNYYYQYYYHAPIGHQQQPYGSMSNLAAQITPQMTPSPPPLPAAAHRQQVYGSTGTLAPGASTSNMAITSGFNGSQNSAHQQPPRRQQ